MASEAALWLREERSGRGPQPEYSRAQIAAAAVKLADAGGLAAASTRRVADAIGTGPASLYRYVRNRGELIALMADQVSGEYEYPQTFTGDWLADILALARQQFAILMRHPWMIDVSRSGAPIGPAAVDFLEQALRALEPVEVGGRVKLEAIAMMSAIVTMFAQEALAGSSTSTDGQEATAQFLAHVMTAGRHPHLAAAMTDTSTPALEGPDLLDRVLAKTLTGLLID